MGELSNALQGKMNQPKGAVKGGGGKQLDLFSSLADRAPTAPRIVTPPVSEPRPDLEMVLPPARSAPPDVSADVRAVLSESGLPRTSAAEADDGGARPLPPTGIYHRPRRTPASLVPPAPPPAVPPDPSRRAWSRGIREWFAGVELDRRMVSLVVVLTVLVALVAYWTARPRKAAVAPGTTIDLAEAVSPAEPAPPSPAVPALPAPTPAPPVPPSPGAPAGGAWKIPGTETTMVSDGYLVRFTAPVFVSTDRISLEGMDALKAVAAKLKDLKSGARVVVTGYTDDQPLSKPTDEFKSNADIAAARARAAAEHLSAYARANKLLLFETATGDPVRAPYPNDTPANRRLNRTVTVQVHPAP